MAITNKFHRKLTKLSESDLEDEEDSVIDQTGGGFLGAEHPLVNKSTFRTPKDQKLD